MSESVLLFPNSVDSIPDKVLKRTQLDFCGSAFLQNGSAFHQDLDEVGKTLVDWLRGNVHCGLIQHLENLLNHSCN